MRSLRFALALLVALVAFVAPSSASAQYPALTRIPAWAATQRCAADVPVDSAPSFYHASDSTRTIEVLAKPSEWPGKAWLELTVANGPIYCLGYVVRVAPAGKPVRYDYYSPSLTKVGSYVVRFSLNPNTLYFDRTALLAHFLGATLTP